MIAVQVLDEHNDMETESDDNGMDLVVVAEICLAPAR